MVDCPVVPVEAVGGIPVPHRPEGILAALVLEHIEAAWSIYLDVVEIFVELQDGDERRYVHEAVDPDVVVILHSPFQLGKVCFDRV